MTRDELLTQIKIDFFDYIFKLYEEGKFDTQDLVEITLRYIGFYEMTNEICDELGAEK